MGHKNYLVIFNYNDDNFYVLLHLAKKIST